MDTFFNNSNDLGGVIDNEILKTPSFSDDDLFLQSLSELVKDNPKAQKKFDAFKELKKGAEKDAYEKGPKIFKYTPPQKRKGKDLSCSEQEFKKNKKKY